MFIIVVIVMSVLTIYYYDRNGSKTLEPQAANSGCGPASDNKSDVGMP